MWPLPIECNQKFSSVEKRLDQRSPIIKKFLLDLAKKYETAGGSLLDVAGGPGKDAVFLVHAGLRVFSSDLSDVMVDEQRKCKQEFVDNGYKQFENWSIFKANMIDIDTVIDSHKEFPAQYDTILCLGAIMFLSSNIDVKLVFYFLRFRNSLYITCPVFTRNEITSLAKSTLGENCKIQVFHDLKDESECPLDHGETSGIINLTTIPFAC
ncbi:hypothetical protein EB796_002218 [Bugula neritina]|uniref:Glycine N-methyltransferase n=1 Tax=Bugula neritina TaxID=10212 RepID=A0A7J7KMU5_BUGNE|nr:hypothetical protein EB796_002218 [Bugula neritina]